MKIEFVGAYKSLKTFTSDELSDFCVLTGKNGSGKSHLLNAIDGSLPNINTKHLYSLKFTPPIYSKQFNGLDNISPKILEKVIIRDMTYSYLQLFRQLNNPQEKKLIQKLVDDRIPVKKVIGAKKKTLEELFGKSTIDDIIYNLPHVRDNKLFSTNWDTQHDLFNQWLSQYDKLVELLQTLSSATGKSFTNLNADDITNYSAHEKFLDILDLFRSKIEIIFLAYSRRRFENDYAYLQKKVYGIENTAVSDQEFLLTYPTPWDTLNKLLKDCNIDLQFSGIENKDVYKMDGIRITFKKPSIDQSIIFDDLSSGEKVIVGLVLKLFTSNYYDSLTFPDLIILDEPDAHLHPELTNLLINVLYNTFVKKHGIKVIITTHSPSTVALAPEECLYVMKNTPTTEIKKISKDKALEMLTEFIPTLSINYKNHRQVFVESQTDIDFYQPLYNRHKNNTTPPYELYFISNGKGKSNCDWVVDIVNKIRESGNITSYGIVDWDNKRVSTKYIKVHGEEVFYSIENIILLPVYLLVCLLESGNCHNIYQDLSLDATYNFYSIGEESSEKLNQFSNWIIDKLKAKYPHYNKSLETKEIEFLNGKRITIPDWFFSTNGHDLIVKVKSVFPLFEKFTNEGSLQKHLSHIIARCYPFVPKISIETIKSLTI